MATDIPKLPPEVVKFIDAQSRDVGNSELASRIETQFGPEFAYTAEQLLAWQLEHRPLTRCRIGKDAEVRSFILDFIGRKNCEDILRSLRSSFPPARVPSRTSLYRFVQQARRVHGT